MKKLLTGLIAGLGEHGLRSTPDSKTQVTIEHVQRVDETVARANGVLWWLPPDGKTQVIRKILGDIILKNGQRTLSLYGDRTHLYFQFSGSSSMVVLDWTEDYGVHVQVGEGTHFASFFGFFWTNFWGLRRHTVFYCVLSRAGRWR